MVRWIAFDDETAEAVVSRFRRGAAEIQPGGSPVESALAAGQSSLLVLPSDTPGRVVLARVTSKSEVPLIPTAKPLQFPPVPMRPRSVKPARKWWQRRSA
jgi:hypothetical protein